MRNPHQLPTGMLLFALLVLASCAQIVTPTGGDKDFTPPEVVSVSPDNNSVNFNRKKITVRFNEFIQLNTPEDLIIISPPLELKPTYTNKGKSLEIRLNSDPQPNTTYNINFGTAIGDNKENNLLKAFNYSFSTGPYLDSGTVNGSITSAFTNKPEAEMTVALYYPDSFTDSTIIKQKPVYLAKTAETGEFRISNLPSSKFVLVAFRDENKNLKADKGEALAFTEQPVNPGDTFNRIQLRAYTPDLFSDARITDTFNRHPDKFVFVTYKKQLSEITNTNGKPVYVNRIASINSDTLHVFTSMNSSDTAARFLADGVPLTVKYKPIFKTEKLRYTFNKQPELNDTIIFRFNNPVLKADTSRIRLFKDSVQIKPSHTQVNPFEYRLTYDWNEKTTYRIEVSDSAFQDLFNQYSIKDKAVFTTKTGKDYGTLLLRVRLPKKTTGQIILQLVDADEKTVHRQYVLTASSELNIDYILPGNYRIKYIYDTNSNGEWDNGNFLPKTQPEKVGYFSEPLNIKAYWDLEQSILIE